MQLHQPDLRDRRVMSSIMIGLFAIEGRAHIHSEYALLADVIVAAEGSTFQDVGHFAAGVVPGVS